MNFPRILILGETFRLNGGGGITLTNLFKDWPAGKIGVITDLIEHTKPDTDYLYYQLGREEIKFPFPFSYIQTYFKSGPYTFQKNSGAILSTPVKASVIGKLKKIIRPAFDKFLNRIGLYAYFYKIKLSPRLIEWIKEFKPDIIYIQPFHNRMMRFGNILYNELKLPYAIHIMDDSIKYINQSVFFKKAFQRKMEHDFKILIENASVHLSIAEAMGDEYEKRYEKKFLSFRNPIDVDKWLDSKIEQEKTESDRLRIIYTGRIFEPTFDTLFDLCKIVDKLNRNGMNVSLEYTLDNTQSFLKKIKNLRGISYHPPVNSKDLPAFIKQFDIFFICLNFDYNTKRYFQFSMSTRVSEGMISGVPNLLYAPSDFAISKYFESTNSGYMVGEKDIDALEQALMNLWKNKELRNVFGKNAIETALRDSDARVVRENFAKSLTL
jgi:glycosyltransferase involved in cell wall biosynthesis